MTSPPRLNDLQLILLSHAANQEDGSALPLPAAANGDTPRTGRELRSLLRRGLFVEAEVRDATASWRTGENDRHIGLLLSDKGREAIGLADHDGVAAGSGDMPGPATPMPPSRTPGKLDTVIALLRREEGATLAEMMTITDWQPHSTRAVLTGLRKKGHVIERSKRGDVTCYRIVGAA